MVLLTVLKRKIGPSFLSACIQGVSCEYRDASHLQSGTGLSPRTKLSGAGSGTSPASRTLRKYLLFKPPSLWYLL